MGDSDDEFSLSQGFKDIQDRMLLLSEKDRARAIKRLSGVHEASSSGENSKFSNLSVRLDDEHKLSRFSGNSKLGSGEVTFKRWFSGASRLISDESVKESRKKILIFRSLTGPAEDIADLYRDKEANEIVEILFSQYGNISDGEDLLIKFHQHIQKVGETASDYLTSLFVELGEVAKYDGIRAGDMALVLVKQFIRGTSDEELLTKLRLDDHIETDIYDFPTLIALVRKEEARRTERRLRQRQQAKVQASVEKEETELEKLRKEVEELRTAQVQQQNQVRKPRYFFCYRCGGDFHYAYDCVNETNKKLVQEKSEKFKNRKN